MKELFEKLEKTLNEFENVIKEKTNYSVEELVNLTGEEKEKAFDKIISNDIKATEDTCLKVYTAKQDGNKAICVEAKGYTVDVLYYGVKGISNVLSNIDVDKKIKEEIIDFICSQIKKEVL